jgi:DivIVA domain-containing protein
MVRGMPDQSSASTEHALMQEITAPLSTLPDDPVPIAASVEFPSALRGYDRIAVDAYVQKTTQLVAELQATRSPEAAVRRALERVGAEVSGILQRAHDTAAQITTQSRSEAEDRLEAARREAAQIVAGAEARVRELDAETDRIWAERHRIVEDTRGLARELLALTETAAERFPADEPDEAEALPGARVDADVDVDDVGDVDDVDEVDDVDARAARGGGEAGPGEGGLGPGGLGQGGVGQGGVGQGGVGHGGVGQGGASEGEDATPGVFSRRHGENADAERDEEPDIESTAVLPTVEPPAGEEGRE